MTRAVIVQEAGPGVSVQDFGREGYLAEGLSRGGAADRLALAEGAALLGQEPGLAAIEMAGYGGLFEVTEDTRIALTGAPMQAKLDGAMLRWNASHLVPAGARLRIGAVEAGVYGYLHLGGGLDLPERLGAQSSHLAAGLGGPLQAGDRLPLGGDARADRAGRLLPVADRFHGGHVRVLPSLQTEAFAPEEIARFEATSFTREPRGNRMGIRLHTDGAGFASDAGLSVLSEVVVPGDIQIAGDGAPFILLSECQTTGGYPRIGCVLPADLPIVAQAAPGAPLSFQFIALEDGLAAERMAAQTRAALPRQVTDLVRAPGDIADLLSYHLISGATTGMEEP